MGHQITLDLFELYFTISLIALAIYFSLKTYYFLRHLKHRFMVCYYSVQAEYYKFKLEYLEIKNVVLLASHRLEEFDARMTNFQRQSVWSSIMSLYMQYVIPNLGPILNFIFGGRNRAQPQPQFRYAHPAPQPIFTPTPVYTNPTPDGAFLDVINTVTNTALTAMNNPPAVNIDSDTDSDSDLSTDDSTNIHDHSDERLIPMTTQ